MSPLCGLRLIGFVDAISYERICGVGLRNSISEVVWMFIWFMLSSMELKYRLQKLHIRHNSVGKRFVILTSIIT